MAQIEVPNVRQGGDVTLPITLTDNGVAVDWTALSGIRVFAYSVPQKAIAGEIEATTDAEDPTTLRAIYHAETPQFLGLAKVIVRSTYRDRVKTFDAYAVNFVETTAEADGVEVLDDPVVPVHISVEEVSTSLLEEAINSAIAAAAEAEAAADEAEAAAAGANSAAESANTAAAAANKAKQDANSAAGRANSSAANANNAAAAASSAAEAAAETATKSPYVGDNGNWFVYDATNKVYVDTGTRAQGPQGQVGPQGAKGVKGDTGATGPRGPRGEKGDKGDTGEVSRAELDNELDKIRESLDHLQATMLWSPDIVWLDEQSW